jgi:hypothetical protein
VKIEIAQPAVNLPHVIEVEGSLPCSQDLPVVHIRVKRMQLTSSHPDSLKHI